MLGVVDRPMVLQFLLNILWNPELLHHPFLHGFVEREESSWPDFKVCMEKTIEKFEERFFIEADCVEIFCGNTFVSQCMLNGIAREGFVVLLPCKPLLLCSEDNFPVFQQDSRTIVVVAGDAQDIDGFVHSYMYKFQGASSNCHTSEKFQFVFGTFLLLFGGNLGFGT